MTGAIDFGRLAAILLGIGALAAQQPTSFNVKQYGAVGDGAATDTTAINKAIDACAAAGGGTVYFPAGVYSTGTIRLKSGVTLWIDNGATIRGSKDLAQYESSLDRQDWYAALILAKGVHNVAIMGGGTIDGNKVFNPKGEERMRGPHAALFVESQDITVRDVTFKDAANYALVMRSCERANVENMTALGGWDGINMHDTRNVTISNCRLFTGDDCLAGAFWENVTVSNCVLNTSCNAFRAGGRNVIVNNCLIYGPGEYEHRTGHRRNLESGFQILPHTQPRGNRLANRVVTPGPVDNMVLSNLMMIRVRSPFFVAYSSDAPYSANNLGVGRIIVNNLTVIDSGRTPFYVSAPAENPAKSIVLNNVRMTFAGGVDEEQSLGQGFSPYSMMQSYGVYCRNVAHLELHDVRVGYRENDRRPALMGENIGTLELERFIAQHEPDGPPSLLFAGIGKLLIDGREASPAKLRIDALELAPPDPFATEPFLASVRVQNPGEAGLGEVPLRIGNRTVTRSVWLKANESARVRFVNQRVNETGAVPVQSGSSERKLNVQPKPAGRPVAAPYRAFQNTDAQVQQIDGGFYIRAAGDSAVLDYADQYGAAYLPKGLAQTGSIVAKLENADSRASWGGRAGIMVRNDVSKPGQAAGYLIFGASPSNGYSLEWDSDGDGRIDKHTELDGYTYWPHWLKLQRSGAKFTGFYSVDGTNWIKAGEADVASAADAVDAGVFAHRSSARFIDVKMTR